MYVCRFKYLPIVIGDRELGSVMSVLSNIPIISILISPREFLDSLLKNPYLR